MAGLALPFLLPPIRDQQLEYTKYLNFLVALTARRRNAIHVPSKPFDLSINPSTACQLACPNCETGNGTMTRPATNLAPSLHSHMLAGVADELFIIRYFGTGESLLNKKFPELMREIRGKEIFTFMTTNLSFRFTDKQIDDILQSGINLIGVSLDGITQESYARYRVNGEHDLVVSNMRRLIERRDELGLQYPLVEWRYLVFRHNEHEVETVRKLAQEYKVDLLEFAEGYAPRDDPAAPVQRLEKFNVKQAMTGPALDAATRAKNTVMRSMMMRQEFEHRLPPRQLKFRKCDWHYFSSYWYPDGGVGPCCIATDISEDFGHISMENSFADIWNGPQYSDARALFHKGSTSESFCRSCRSKPTMDRFFITSVKGILLNAPSWVLKTLAQDTDRFFLPIDEYYLSNELKALRNFPRAYNGNFSDQVRHIRKLAERNIVMEPHLKPLAELLETPLNLPRRTFNDHLAETKGRIRLVMKKAKYAVNTLR
ncbi:MAG: radical SAM protein [Gammaproteobacteria bacterium]|nr:radical SAM protein [Gammaproteobacteria bacterium]